MPTTFPFWDFPKILTEIFFDIEPRSRRFPMASTCGLQLQLPRGIHSFDEFEGLIVRALKEGSHGFGKISETLRYESRFSTKGPLGGLLI